jgi:endonuclease/exonuclease/phosphatase family metal-dependent hydrolase
MKRCPLVLAALLLATTLATPAAAAPVRVLTYNVGLLEVFGSDYVPIVKERAAAAAGEIACFASERSPDLIVLQEVWRRSQAKAITEALAPLGYEVARPKGCTLIGTEGGLLVAVKRPLAIASWSFARYRKSTFLDSIARKGVLQTVIENSAAGVRFVLLATHTLALDTDRGTPVDGKQVAAIAAQLDSLLVQLDRASEAGRLPALLVGDFNVGPGYADASYRLVADAPGIREAGAVADPAAAWVTWDPANPLVHYGGYPNEPAAKIDHVFLRDGGEGRWTVKDADVVFTEAVAGLSLVPSRGSQPVPTPLSDHYGFLADLDLESGR